MEYTYTVYIKNAGEWIPWCNEISYTDAIREVEFLRKYEGVEAMVA